MRNVVTKLYERNCGDAGKFIVLEAGRENADGLYEGVSMYGHYFVDSNYDDTYVRLFSDDDYKKFKVWDDNFKKILLYMKGVKINSALEDMVESYSNNAKSDVFKQFLQQYHEKNKDELININSDFYSQNFGQWKEIYPCECKRKNYKQFFHDVNIILKKVGFAQIDGIE